MMSMADAMAATAFNAAPHAKTDTDVDVTALVRYAPNAHAAYEFGYARKSRAPNLYERYSWGRGSMSSRMIGWFGDGNGYVGNLALKPEVAHTLSATGSWAGGAAMPWALKLTPYYTRIENYIGVTKLADFTNMMGMSTGFVQLQFANHEAELYGADLTASMGLWNSVQAGKADLKLTAGWVEGRDLTVGGDLYHLMPVHARLSFEHSMGAWSSAAELELVGRKSRVDDIRHEPLTPAYALLNLRGGYTWRNLRFDAGIENVFDTAYDLPLGGLSLGDYKATGTLRPVPGMGRSVNIAVTASL
jgi:iron complex outermembrane receptor protein